ncbi:acyltransferase family protein [Rubripirellula sp.]|nr:acyltransferase family protein [Rubripirellula sp.]MDB4749991.1 acyltransferase family protein [Rubripirellula sp.]
MLWRKRGLLALFKQRSKRILLPLILAMWIIIPLLWIVTVFISVYPNKSSEEDRAVRTTEVQMHGGIWQAARTGDIAGIEVEIAAGADLNTKESGSGVTPLGSAVVGNQPEAVTLLLDNGADPNQRTMDNSTPLHWACILGRAEIAAQLIDAETDVAARNNYQATAADNLKLDWPATEWVVNLMNAEFDQKEIEKGRNEIRNMLRTEGEDIAAGLFGLFFLFPFFHHLWFLWFLCWLILGFSIYAVLADRFKIINMPQWFTASPLRYLWLIPLTMLPQAFMGLQTPTFGPDTSVGLLPLPQVLFYYAIFFGFGALYYDCGDDVGRFGKRWYITLPFAVFLLFPLGMLLMKGESVFLNKLPEEYHRIVFILVQVLFAWTVTCGLMGMFRRLLNEQTQSFRYISDSSYWLYLAHMPLVLILQFIVRDWPLSAFFKFTLVCGATTVSLLISYHLCIRYTWLGSLLNGSKKRQQPILMATLSSRNIASPQPNSSSASGD